MPTRPPRLLPQLRQRLKLLRLVLLKLRLKLLVLVLQLQLRLLTLVLLMLRRQGLLEMQTPPGQPGIRILERKLQQALGAAARRMARQTVPWTLLRGVRAQPMPLVIQRPQTGLLRRLPEMRQPPVTRLPQAPISRLPMLAAGQRRAMPEAAPHPAKTMRCLNPMPG